MVDSQKTSDDTESPAGLNARPDGGAGVSRLSKKPILMAGCAAIALFAIVYASFYEMHGHKITSGGVEISPANSSLAELPAAPKAIQPMTMPNSTSVSAPTPQKQAEPSQPNQPTRPNENYSQPNAQETAAEQANQQLLQQQAQNRAQAMSAAFSSAAGASTKWQLGDDTKNSGGTDTKQAALPSASANYNSHLVTKSVSPFVLTADSDIPATLTTAIQSDLPGPIKAIVSQNVYDSESESHLLIPAGSQLVGTYSDKIIAGQTRVGVDWYELIFPNGNEITLDAMTGVDGQGQAGFHDQVNFHTWEIFKNALLMSMIQVGVAMAQPGYGNNNNNGNNSNNESAQQLAESQMATTFGNTEAQIMQRYINIAPTLNIRAGYQFDVAVTHDIIFPGAYDPTPTAPVTEPAQAVDSPIQNPY